MNWVQFVDYQFVEIYKLVVGGPVEEAIIRKNSNRRNLNFSLASKSHCRKTSVGVIASMQVVNHQKNSCVVNNNLMGTTQPN